MNRIVLSQDQMKHLKELGLDITDASMAWQGKILTVMPVNPGYIESVKDKMVPAYTLQDILDKIPQRIPFEEDEIGIACFEMNPMAGGDWFMGYEYSPDGELIRYAYKQKGDILESAYNIFCQCIENGFIKN